MCLTSGAPNLLSGLRQTGVSPTAARGETHASNGRPRMVALGLSGAGLSSEMASRRSGKQITLHLGRPGNLGRRIYVTSQHGWDSRLKRHFGVGAQRPASTPKGETPVRIQRCAAVEKSASPVPPSPKIPGRAAQTRAARHRWTNPSIPPAATLDNLASPRSASTSSDRWSTRSELLRHGWEPRTS